MIKLWDGTELTIDQLKEAVESSKECEISMDEVLGDGDLATSTIIIEQLINRIEKAEDMLDYVSDQLAYCLQAQDMM